MLSPSFMSLVAVQGLKYRPRGEGGFSAQRQKDTVGVVNNDLNIEWGHLAGALDWLCQPQLQHALLRSTLRAFSRMDLR